MINSRLGLFTAAIRRWRPFSRSYGAILPSSLAMNHSSALGYSPRLPVSVYGTGIYNLKLRGFSWKSLGSLHAAVALWYFPLSAQRADLPTPIKTYGVKRTIPSVRGSFITPSPHRSYKQYWNINQLSIHFPLRVRVRSRLTLIRLALIRKP